MRIIAASNKNLAELLSRGLFREDLFYRLNVIRIELPPLAQRREDIPLLVERFVHLLNIKKGKKIAGVSRDVMDLLMNYDFPGNIRELENIIEHAFVLCRDSLITLEHLPPGVTGRDTRQTATMANTRVSDFKKAEAQVLRDMLEKHGCHRARTARELGIDASTLWRKMKRLGIKP